MSQPWHPGLLPEMSPSYYFTALPEQAEDHTFQFMWSAPGATSHPTMTQRHHPNSLPPGTVSGQHTPPYSSQASEIWSDPAPPGFTERTSVSGSSSEGIPDTVSNAQHQPFNHVEQVAGDLHSQFDPLQGIGPMYPTQEIPQHLLYLPENLKDLHDGNAEHVVAATANQVPPRHASQRMSTRPGMGVPGQGVDDTEDLSSIIDTVRRVIARNPNPQSSSPSVLGLGSIRGEITKYLDSVWRRQMPPPDSKKKQYYRCQADNCGFEGSNKATFKRHVEVQHYPRWEFYCHHDNNCCTSLATRPRRKDKIREHYKNHHKEFPSDDIIKDRKVLLPCETVCICSRTVYDWDDFYQCFMEHCKCEPPSVDDDSQDSHGRPTKRRRDDSNGGSFDRGTGNGGSASYKQGYGRSGNADGGGQHHSFSGVSGNQLSNGDSRPILRARSVSDSYDGRPKGSQSYQATEESPPMSESRPSGSGSNQRGRSKKKSTRPPLDLRGLQGQASSHSSVNNCKTCGHVFNSCSTCCDSPPSADRCHICPPMERTQAVHVNSPHEDLALSQSLRMDRDMRFADPLHFNPQAGPDILTTVNPQLYIATEQYDWQINQARQEHAPAQGMIPRTNRQQSFFQGNQSYMAGAVHEVQVRGMSELEMEISIMDSKSKGDSNKSQGSSTWSVSLPFRSSPEPLRGSKSFLSGPPLPLRKPLTGTSSISAGGMEITTREVIGPLSLDNPSSGCRCPCRTRPQAMYFARGRLDIAPGRMIEVDFQMLPEARGMKPRGGIGHPLRTRIHVVVKMFRLRTAARSTSDKHKKEACAAFKEALEATVYGPDAETTIEQEDAKLVALDNSGSDWEAESVAESISTEYTQASTGTDITVPCASNLPRPPSLIFSRTSSCTDLTLPSRPSSPAISGFRPKSPYTDLKLHTRARSRSPLRWSLDDDTLSNEELPIQDVGLYEKEEELALDSDLRSSLDRLSRWTGGVPADELRSGVSAWNPERVCQYLLGHSLSVIFSQASRDNGLNPSWDKKPSF
ncbi:hypothetical protein PMG11_05862 [Penicillium brasilianum]|uniref:C2H2-type domain-containing protein n=1 Tax=Penicillium brasilianum TaxID=104259 RepID=A0A0F7TQ95_PENBI|nr:hypothetical protein PMG11_05862 [Penicillium brasilianum]